MESKTVFNGLLENSINTGLKKNFKEAIETTGVKIDSETGLWSYPEILSAAIEFNSDCFRTLIVNELPTENISLSTMYLLKIDSENDNDIFAEYVYIKTSDGYTWEKLGETGEETEPATMDEIDAIFK